MHHKQFYGNAEVPLPSVGTNMLERQELRVARYSMQSAVRCWLCKNFPLVELGPWFIAAAQTLAFVWPVSQKGGSPQKTLESRVG